MKKRSINVLGMFEWILDYYKDIFSIQKNKFKSLTLICRSSGIDSLNLYQKYHDLVYNMFRAIRSDGNNVL